MECTYNEDKSDKSDKSSMTLENIVLYCYILFISLLLLITLYMSYKYLAKHYFKQSTTHNIDNNNIDIIQEKDRINISKLLEQFIKTQS